MGGIFFPSLNGAEPESDSFVPFPERYVPEQYFEIKEEASLGNGIFNNWRLFFPHNPEFRYAFLFNGSFEREMGFYLEGDELHWARIVGISPWGYSYQLPFVKKPSALFSLYWQQILACFSPASLPFSFCVMFRELMSSNHRAISADEEKYSPFYPFDNSPKVDTTPQSYISVFLSLFLIQPGSDYILNKIIEIVESHGEEPSYIGEQGGVWDRINSTLYGIFSTSRGKVFLREDTAEELRKTWDLAVGKRTFSMPCYRSYLQMLDGNYAYFRAGTGAIGEDIFIGSSPMRKMMEELSFAMVDMASMNDFGEEPQVWVRARCRKIREYAETLGNSPPPCHEKEWCDSYFKTYSDALSKYDDAEKNGQSLSGDEKSLEDNKVINREVISGYYKKFLKPLDDNPEWKDMFPKDGGACPGFLIIDPSYNRAFSIRDGMLMVCESYMSPATDYIHRSVNGAKAERNFYSYDGTGSRIARNFIKLSKGEEELLISILNKFREKLGDQKTLMEKKDLFYPLFIYRDREGKDFVSLVDDDEKGERLLDILQNTIEVYTYRTPRMRSEIRFHLSYIYEQLSEE